MKSMIKPAPNVFENSGTASTRRTALTRFTARIALTASLFRMGMTPLFRGFLALAALILILLLMGCSTMETRYNDHDTHIEMTRSVPPVFGEYADVAVTFEQEPDGTQKIGFVVKNRTDGFSWIDRVGTALAGIGIGRLWP